jgi:hypothetical protein
MSAIVCSMQWYKGGFHVAMALCDGHGMVWLVLFTQCCGNLAESRCHSKALRAHSLSTQFCACLSWLVVILLPWWACNGVVHPQLVLHMFAHVSKTHVCPHVCSHYLLWPWHCAWSACLSGRPPWLMPCVRVHCCLCWAALWR